MRSIHVTAGGGIAVRLGDLRILLDPHVPAPADLVFVSHAHIDHLHPPTKKTPILSSPETAALAAQRGYHYAQRLTQLDHFPLYDSGHILGSRGVLLRDEIFYTGDIAGRPRAFLPSGIVPRCRTLLIETTYGRAFYRFPPVAAVVEQVNRLLGELFDKGVPAVLLGYQLGKAQVLAHLFGSWQPLYLFAAVHAMNEVHRRFSVPMPEHAQLWEEAEVRGLLRRKPWVAIAPGTSGRRGFVRRVKEEYGAVTLAFTGWAASPKIAGALGVDYAFPLSDHCDFDDLVTLVKRAEPEKIFTVHGFAEEFADHLRGLGYDAQALLGAQQTLRDYLESD